MLAIGTVVAVVWGLVKAFKALIGETPEEKLKRTKEEAASLKESLNEVKTAADELKNSFNEYDEI
jgi:cell shape-determining protein MreC